MVYVLGLSVAYLSGRQSSEIQFGKYSQDDVDALRALAEESGVVDLFLTYPFLTFVLLDEIGTWSGCSGLFFTLSTDQAFLNYLSSLTSFILMNGLWESQRELRLLIFLQTFLIPLVVISLFLNW